MSRSRTRGRKLQKGSPSPPPWRASRRRENTKAEKAKGKDDEKKIEKKKEETRTPEEKKDTKETEVKEAQEACDQELQSKRERLAEMANLKASVAALFEGLV